MTDFIFKGSAGRIEGSYHQNENPEAPVALILHGNSQEGENMNKRIIQNLFDVFVKNKFSVLKINFRGVGRSEGKFDKGKGELLDAIAALDWLHQKNMEAKSFWAAGFSFGAWTALQLVMRRPEIEDYVLISPPAKKRDFNFIVPCSATGLVLYGDEDEKIPEENINDLLEKLTTKAESKIEYGNIDGADHHFSYHQDELIKATDKYVKKRLLDMMGRVRKVRRDRRRRRKKKKKDTQEEKIVYLDPIKPLKLDD